MDVIVDYYFVCLENLGDELELLEELLIASPEKAQINKIHKLKRQINSFRHSVWPTREIINRLLRGDSNKIKETTEIFLRDLYDHIINVSENLESYRDTASGLAELYLTNISNRMNEIMKVLTIIATIFIPLSFFAGVYGMNFEFMPELKWEWGYYIFWVLIIILSTAMLSYFHKKKWL